MSFSGIIEYKSDMSQVRDEVYVYEAIECIDRLGISMQVERCKSETDYSV